MFPIRRAALRFLSSPTASFTGRTRTIASFAATPFRTHKQNSSLVYQRRWVSDEANKEEAPISKLQPTPQEEVENAIAKDNATQTIESSSELSTESTQQPRDAMSGNAEGVNAPEATSDATSVQSALGKVKEAVTDAAASVVAPLRSPPAPRDAEALGYSAQGARNVPKHTIYVGNLFFDVTEDDLTKELARFGRIERVKLIRDNRGLSKGFGYVTFSTIEDASKAVESLNQQLFEGRRLNVAYAATNAPPFTRNRESQDKPLNPPTSTLFIGNMSWEMTDRDLNNLFRGIKNVIDVRVAIDRRTGQPRGFAHADFTDVASAMEGMKALEGKESYGRKLKLDYSYGLGNAPRNQARNRGDL